MTQKYSIHNQTTGLSEEATTFEDALILQKKIQQDWIDFNQSIFTITILVQNEDGTWTQNVADNQGNPVTSPDPQPNTSGGIDMNGSTCLIPLVI